MTYPTIDQYNTSQGMGTLFTYTVDVVPFFPQLILFAFFMIIFLGTFFYQRRQQGSGNPAGSFAVAGFMTALLALGFSLLPNFINLPTLVSTFAIAMIGFIWLVFGDRE